MYREEKKNGQESDGDVGAGEKKERKTEARERERERERDNLLGSIVNMMIHVHTCTNKNYNEGLNGLIQGDMR